VNETRLNWNSIKKEASGSQGTLQKSVWVRNCNLTGESQNGRGDVKKELNLRESSLPTCHHLILTSSCLETLISVNMNNAVAEHLSPWLCAQGREPHFLFYFDSFFLHPALCLLFRFLSKFGIFQNHTIFFLFYYLIFYILFNSWCVSSLNILKEVYRRDTKGRWIL
jgi:hypothetical protein